MSENSIKPLSQSWRKYLYSTMILGFAYFVTGLLSLKLAVPPGYASAIFPAAGIALGASILMGPKSALGIFLGSFFMNLYSGPDFGALSLNKVLLASLIAIGSGAQAQFGALLIQRQFGALPIFGDERGILKFLILGGPVACILNSAWSVFVLFLFKQLEPPNLLYNWSMWWVGDSVGAMIFAPLVLALNEGGIFKWTSRKLVSVVPTLFLFSLTIIFYLVSSQKLTLKTDLELRRKLELNTNYLEEYFEHFEIALTGLSRLLTVTPDLNQKDFSTFVNPHLKHLRGMIAFAWAPRVLHKDRSKFEDSARKIGLERYQISELNKSATDLVPASVRDQYFPALYVEATQARKRTFGFDFISSEYRRAAIQVAIDTGRHAATGRVLLVDGGPDSKTEHAGFLIYLPVYQTTHELKTVQERREKVAGVVSAVVDFEHLLPEVFSKAGAEELGFLIYDETQARSEFIRAFGTNLSPELNHDPERVARLVPWVLAKESHISFAGRKWRIVAYPAQNFGVDLSAWSSLLVGLLLVILLQIVLLSVTSRARLIEALVEEKTVEAKRLVLELKNERSQLNESRAFLGRIVDHLPVALFCKDVTNDYRFSLWNKRATEMWGLSETDVIGKSDFDFFPKEQATYFREKDQEVMKAGQVVDIPEEPLRTPDRGDFILHTRKVPVLDEKGNPKTLLGISEDITDRKRAQKTIEEQRLKIIHASKMSALGEMAGGIAHEINNPLAIIQSGASLLQVYLEYETLDRNKLNALADNINKTVTRIASIIRGMRNFARDAENDPFALTKVEDLLREATVFCSSRLASAGVELRIVEPDPGLVVECRRVQISQVLVNLINNGADAVDGTPHAFVELSARERGDICEIRVRDSGKGISAELQRRIMEPFFSTKPPGKGTGLGLSISNEIVKSHHGTLTLDINSEHTCFVVQLPKKQT